MKTFLRACIAGSVLLIGGCAAVTSMENTVADIEQREAQTQPYPLTESEALSIIRAAFKEGWPDKTLTPLEQGRKGYEITLWFAIDREHVIAEVLPADDGVYFRIINRGTAPVSGIPAREKLTGLIELRAKGD